MRALLASALLLAALALAGCGEDGGDSTTTQGSEASAPRVAQGEEQAKGSTATALPTPEGAEGLSPKAAAYYAERLEENFPPPKPAPKARQLSQKAIHAGEQTCKGATPTEIAERYEDEAKLDPDQEELLAELPRYEEEAVKDPSFVAGQIAAMVYEATLSAEKGDYGFQGCVFALARGLGAGLGEVE